MHIHTDARFFTALLVLMLLVAAFGPAPVIAEERGDRLVQQQPGSAGRTFVMGMLSPTDLQLNPMESFSATEAQLFTALYEGLVSYHPSTLEPVPAVAREWEVGSDGLEYTFHLRQDARYGNGDPVTAAHFRDTWLAILDPETRAPYSFLYDVIEGAEAYRRGESEDPGSVGIEVVSPKVLRVTLAHPATHFLDILAHHSFSPVHPRMRRADDWDSLSSIIGNGPYSIAERDSSGLLLRRNDYYWDYASVAIGRIRIRFMDDPRALTDGFSNGNIHWVSSGIALDRIRESGDISIDPMFATRYFYVRAGDPPFDNPDVRRALALLLPWEEIRSSDFHFIPAETLIPQIPFYPQVDRIADQDVEEARSLLENAGYPDGRGLPSIVLKVPGSVSRAREARIIRDALREHLETEVSIEAVDPSVYYDGLESDDYLIGSMSWIGDFADPLTFLQMWTSGSNLNDADYDNPDYDELIRTSMSQEGRSRYRTLAEAEEMLLTTAVVMPVSHSPAINLIDRNRIDGWHSNPLDIHPFKYLSFAPMEIPPNVAGRGGSRPRFSMPDCRMPAFLVLSGVAAAGALPG